MPALPPALRALTPRRLRDDPRARALAVGLGLIPPRRMHSDADAAVLAEAARGVGTAVEIGVYEGSSALLLASVLSFDADLHLVDPFGHHPDALPGGWGATEWATRRVLARAPGPRVHWHVELSSDLARRWRDPVDLVFVDGDHSEAGCRRDWEDWRRFVRPGGHVVFHDARADQPDGRGLPGPTAVLRAMRTSPPEGWTIAMEADRTVAWRRHDGDAAAP